MPEPEPEEFGEWRVARDLPGVELILRLDPDSMGEDGAEAEGEWEGLGARSLGRGMILDSRPWSRSTDS